MQYLKVKDTESYRLTRMASTFLYRMVNWQGENLFITPICTLVKGKALSLKTIASYTMWVDANMMEAAQ